MKKLLIIFFLFSLIACRTKTPEEYAKENTDGITTNYDKQEETDENTSLIEENTEYEIPIVEERDEAFEDLITTYKKTLTDKKQMQFTIYGNNNYLYQANKSISYYSNNELRIIKNLIKINTKARPGTTRDIRQIVIHETGNTDKTANAFKHAQYLSNNTNTSTSWHYTVDQDGIYQHIPDIEVAWHAGDGTSKYGGNMSGIGIEMCVNQGNDVLATWHNCAKLVAKLLEEYGLEMEAVKMHYDFSLKICPQSIIRGNLWSEFLKYISAEVLMSDYKNYLIEYDANQRHPSNITTITFIELDTKNTRIIRLL